MDKYKVILNSRAYRDLDNIFAYIALEKLSPHNAQNQTDRIWSALRKLDIFHRHIRNVMKENMQGKDIGSY